VSTIEELLGIKGSGSGLETEITAVGIRRADYATPLYPQKLALTSLKSSGRTVDIVRSWTKAAEISFFSFSLTIYLSLKWESLSDERMIL
jgi:hypothetical protein